MTPQAALKEYGHKLTPFEQKEILEYPEIWFLGLESKKTEGIPGAAQNAGVCVWCVWCVCGVCVCVCGVCVCVVCVGWGEEKGDFKMKVELRY